MKLWKVASSIATGAVAVFVIVFSYSIPVNPCTIFPSQNVDTILAPTTSKELYDNAELVVIGRITDSTAKCEGSQIWTHMQVEVEEYLKNSQETNTLAAKSIGGTIGNYGYGREDSPIYNIGDRVLLYLYRENAEDRIYSISYPTGVIQEQGVTGRELLRSFAIKSSSNDTITVAKGAFATVGLSLESYFGYNSPTNVIVSAFTYYNSTDDSATSDSFNTANLTAFSDFGLSVEPAYAMITPPANGTAQTEFRIDVSNNAIQGVYDIAISAREEGRILGLSPNIEHAFFRINVTDNENRSHSDKPVQILTSEGITLGAPYLVQISWNLSETFQGNETDLSVLIKDKETMEPLKEVTYDFMHKGLYELGGFQDKYVGDFANLDKFRTGIKEPCDMHLTIFIEKVGDLSFAKTDPDEIKKYGNTPSVVIQFRTFPEEESVKGCDARDNIRLMLFNGYDLDGKQLPSATPVNSESAGTNSSLSQINSNFTGVSDTGHCTQDQEALRGLSELVKINAPSVASEDENIRLILYTKDAEVTEYEDQYFSVLVENKANHPVLFPQMSGEQYTIAFYSRQGELITKLGGHQTPYPGYGLSSDLQKPACIINPGESRVFYAQTRIGTKDHQTPTILFASASIAYLAEARRESLTTVMDTNISTGTREDEVGIDELDTQLNRNATNLLKIVVNPIELPVISKTHYFDGSLAFPYVPKVGEEKPLWVISRTTTYQGKYDVEVYLPEGIELVSGETRKHGYFFPHKYIGTDGILVVKVVEQEAAKMVIRPVKLGNYALRAFTYTDFNGTLIGNEDVIWFSTFGNGTSSMITRTALPNSIEPLIPFELMSIQGSDPIPKISINEAGSNNSYGAAAADFCWSDRPKWWEQNEGASFDTICDFSYPLTFGREGIPATSQKIILTNRSLLNININNINSVPSLLLVDLYSYEDIYLKNRNISKSYSSCVIYSPTGGYRTSNPYQYCPLETQLSVINNTRDYTWAQNVESGGQSYEISIATHKPGYYILGAYAQWASEAEMTSNFAYRSLYYQFAVVIQ